MYRLVLGLLIIAISNGENIQLNITNGPILGKTAYTVGMNNLMYVFQGIPYAEPPLRFELAVAKAPWNDVINCTYDKPQCVQGSDPVTGSENCLTLSVYSPNLNGSLPVLVWIHGGYFTMGNGSYTEQAPDFLIDENIVFVQIQYRLGVFGFLSTEDSTCPGNLGFKDQVLALKWVQSNIKYFGGNPDKVTLGGQSAGAVAASLHLQSPLSQGLFQALVLNSGSSVNLWGMNRRAKETAFAIGAATGVLALTSQQLIDGLKTKSYTDLQKASDTVSTTITLQNPLAGIYFGYVPEANSTNAFFTGKSEEQLSNGNFKKVPLMLGFTSKEAKFFGNITLLIRTYLLTYDLAFIRLVPADLTTSINVVNKTLAGTAIKSHFFGALDLITIDDDDLKTFVSSDQFERPIWQFGMDVSKYVNETYFYQFSYTGKSGEDEGVGHAEDLSYLFNRKISAEDIPTRNRTVRLWSNFVKYWNPTPEIDSLLQNQTWLPLRNGNVNGGNYFNINSTLETLKNPKNTHIEFWNNASSGIYPTYGQGVYDTY